MCLHCFDISTELSRGLRMLDIFILRLCESDDIILVWQSLSEIWFFHLNLFVRYLCKLCIFPLNELDPNYFGRWSVLALFIIMHRCAKYEFSRNYADICKIWKKKKTFFSRKPTLLAFLVHVLVFLGSAWKDVKRWTWDVEGIKGVDLSWGVGWEG